MIILPCYNGLSCKLDIKKLILCISVLSVFLYCLQEFFMSIDTSQIQMNMLFHKKQISRDCGFLTIVLYHSEHRALVFFMSGIVQTIMNCVMFFHVFSSKTYLTLLHA